MRLSALLPLLALAAAVPLAHAQSDYPSRPVRIIVPFPPGGAADTLARIYGQRMAEDWGKPVVVENRPGAGGIIGTEALAKSAPDGYSLIVVTVGHAVNASLMPKLPYDTATDFSPVALLATLPSLVVVNPALPAKDVKDLIALAKAKPAASPTRRRAPARRATCRRRCCRRWPACRWSTCRTRAPRRR
jgi:tripartite-type tricarboxylate transporter receptor subunit TctC